MGDVSSGIVTTQVGGWTVTSNSAKDEGTLRASLKPKVEAALSNAGKELGKKGAEAKAKAAEEKSEPAPAKEPEAKPEPKEAAPAKAEAKPADEKAEKAEPEPEAKPEEKPLGNPRHDPRARMLEATRKEAEAKRIAREAQARAEALEARLAALERGEKPAPQAEAKPERDRSQKPSPADFESYEEYLDARDDYNRAQWESQVRESQARSAVDRALSDQVTKFHKAASQHLDQFSDDVLSLRTEFQLAEGEEPSGENWIANELVFSPETAPSLMLHFSAHPEDLQRIAALSTPRAVSREMAKLEARLEAAPTGNGAKRDEDVSRAAPPVKPVTGKPYVTEEGYRQGMSLDEYVRWRKRQKA